MTLTPKIGQGSLGSRLTFVDRRRHSVSVCPPSAGHIHHGGRPGENRQLSGRLRSCPNRGLTAGPSQVVWISHSRRFSISIQSLSRMR